jgi:hypothetical protein
MFVDIFKQVKEDLANSTRVTKPFELKDVGGSGQAY